MCNGNCICGKKPEPLAATSHIADEELDLDLDPDQDPASTSHITD